MIKVNFKEEKPVSVNFKRDDFPFFSTFEEGCLCYNYEDEGKYYNTMVSTGSTMKYENLDEFIGDWDSSCEEKVDVEITVK
jgi:hypothetical protein